MKNMNKLNQCVITLTRNCNLRCEFCYAKQAGYSASEFIEFSVLKQLIDLCNDAGAKYIVLTGGEPLLYPDIIRILDYIKSRPHKMIVALNTNGILLQNYEFCKKILDCGVSYIDVSMKGRDAQEWLNVTGYDGFEQQLKAISNLSVLHAEFTCSMVITHKNVDTFCQTVKNAYNSGARIFSFTFLIDTNRSEERDLNYLTLNNPLKKLEGKLAEPCYVRKGSLAFEFDAKLNLIPCGMLLDVVMGKFGSDFSSYSEIERYINVNQGPYQSAMDSLRQLPSAYCLSCKYKASCMGGCPWFWRHCSFDALKEFKLNNGHAFDYCVVTHKKLVKDMVRDKPFLEDFFKRALV